MCCSGCTAYLLNSQRPTLTGPRGGPWAHPVSATGYVVQTSLPQDRIPGHPVSATGFVDADHVVHTSRSFSQWIVERPDSCHTRCTADPLAHDVRCHPSPRPSSRVTPAKTVSRGSCNCIVMGHILGLLSSRVCNHCMSPPWPCRPASWSSSTCHRHVHGAREAVAKNVPCCLRCAARTWVSFM